MATDLIMPRLPGPQQQSFYSHFQHPRQQHVTMSTPPLSMPMPYQQPAPMLPQQQHQRHQQQPSAGIYTPQISPLSTSGNGSPTSPTKSHITRPIRPLYMPAVLRPTEFPSKALPPKSRPDGTVIDGDSDEFRLMRSNSSFMSLGGLGLSRLGRRSTGDSGKFVDDEWNLDLFPKPTGAPTRNHWKPDQESSVCDHATCKRYFSFLARRHHCRRCGNIFCDSHSAFEVPLDQDANYNPRGTPSRACPHCYAEFKEWRSRTNSHASTTSSGADEASQTPTPVSPLPASPMTLGARVAEAAMSVPRDWNWSTF